MATVLHGWKAGGWEEGREGHLWLVYIMNRKFHNNTKKEKERKNSIFFPVFGLCVCVSVVRVICMSPSTP